MWSSVFTGRWMVLVHTTVAFIPNAFVFFELNDLLQ
jgi:hypothetical protein